MPISAKTSIWIELRRVCGTRHGLIALAFQRSPDNMKNRAVVLRLSDDGNSISAAVPFPISHPGVCWNLVVTGPTSAMAMVTDRETTRTILPSGLIHDDTIDTPTWFRVDWKDRLTINELGCWDDVNMVIDAHVARYGQQSVWTASEQTFEMTGFGDFRLVLGVGRGRRMPEAISTDVVCADTSQSVQIQNRTYVLTTRNWRQLELWSFDEQWNPELVATIAKAPKSPTRKVGQIGKPHLVRRGGTLIAYWVAYTDPHKGGTWHGEILTSLYDVMTDQLTSPQRVVDDDKVVSPTLTVTDLGKSTLVMWESRPKRGGGGTRAVRLTDDQEMPAAAVTLKSDLPLFAVEGKGDSLLHKYYQRDSKGWMSAECLPDLER